MTAETATIFIDSSIRLDMDDASCQAAEQAAQQFEVDVQSAPQDTLLAIKTSQDTLANPNQADLVDQLKMTPRQREIAANIATLLHHTSDGSYIDVSDEFYAKLSADDRHKQLVLAAQNADRRRGVDPIIARRRVGLSTLQLYARHYGDTSQPQPSGGISTDHSEVA